MNNRSGFLHGMLDAVEQELAPLPRARYLVRKLFQRLFRAKRAPVPVLCAALHDVHVSERRTAKTIRELHPGPVPLPIDVLDNEVFEDPPPFREMTEEEEVIWALTDGMYGAA